MVNPDEVEEPRTVTPKLKLPKYGMSSVQEESGDEELEDLDDVKDMAGARFTLNQVGLSK